MDPEYGVLGPKLSYFSPLSRTLLTALYHESIMNRIPLTEKYRPETFQDLVLPPQHSLGAAVRFIAHPSRSRWMITFTIVQVERKGTSRKSAWKRWVVAYPPNMLPLLECGSPEDRPGLDPIRRCPLLRPAHRALYDTFGD
jgi:hypothetical protein